MKWGAEDLRSTAWLYKCATYCMLWGPFRKSHGRGGRQVDQNEKRNMPDAFQLTQMVGLTTHTQYIGDVMIKIDGWIILLEESRYIC